MRRPGVEKAVLNRAKTLKKSIAIDYHAFRKALLMLRVVAHPERSKVISLLKDNKEMSVSHLHQSLNAKQSIISQHLAALRRIGLVSGTRHNKFVYYSINRNRYEEIKNFIDAMSDTPAKTNTLSMKKALMAASVLRALAHPFRLKLLCFIDAQKEINVNKIYGTLKQEQSITSQNLKILREAGLVHTRRNGKFIIYSVNYEAMDKYTTAIYTLLKKKTNPVINTTNMISNELPS